MNKGCHFCHLTLNDRLVIERLNKKNWTKKKIAEAIGCCERTVYYELKRATYMHLNTDLTLEERYNPDMAERLYRENLSKKGVQPKLASDNELMNCLKELIVKNDYSPQAALYHIQNEGLDFSVQIKSVGTVYRAIKQGIVDGVTMKKLPHGRRRKRSKRVVRQKRASAGTSIEKRPKKIDERDTFGNWEMDSVIGQASNKKTCLVFTERKTRMEIIEEMQQHTSDEVVKALNRLEKRFKSDFYKIFKTITIDNGVEFQDFEGMEQALYRIGKRTKTYYCHPSRPDERGSNENCNRLIRRKLPKGMNFDKKLNRTLVKEVESWVNNYPRKLFNGKSALHMFQIELEKIGCRLRC